MPEITNPVKVAYCKRQGYDFIFESAQRTPERPPSWEKLPAIAAALKGYDAVMWMDDDAVPSNFNVRFEGLLPEGYYMAIARDMLYLNCGVMVLRNSQQSFDLLEKWGSAKVFEAWKNAELWEQDPFQRIHAARPEGIMIHPSRMMNSFEGRFRKDSNMYREWKPGDFVYHFSGQAPFTGEKRAFLRERINEIGRLHG